MKAVQDGLRVTQIIVSSCLLLLIHIRNTLPRLLLGRICGYCHHQPHCHHHHQHCQLFFGRIKIANKITPSKFVQMVKLMKFHPDSLAPKTYDCLE